MIVVYTGEQPPDTFASSIFLAGPSPRKPADPNWRAEAIQILDRLGYQGVVFAPVWRDPNAPGAFDYDKQIWWERKHLNMSDQIVFWVPRDLQTLPGFTTNVEYGVWLRSGKIMLGSPEGAPKMDYLDWWACREHVDNYRDLGLMLRGAIDKLGAGALRSGGQREVPLHLWQKSEFQHWLSCQEGENRLEGAEVVWTFRVGARKEKTFLWALHIRVWIASEQRSKVNEVVVFRPDVSAIVAYRDRWPDDGYDRTIMDTEIVLVREFRSPAANVTAMVHELPGGSSVRPGVDPKSVAADEFREETALTIDASRFRSVGVRQIAATLSAHRGHVFKVALTAEEMAELRAHAETPKGNHADTEYTWVEILTVRELLANENVDWSNLGMVFHALMGA